MNQVKTNRFAIEKISEFVIGNLIVLLAGCLGYLTGFLKAILGNPEGQFNGANEDGSYHYNGEFRRFFYEIHSGLFFSFDKLSNRPEPFISAPISGANFHLIT